MAKFFKPTVKNKQNNKIVFQELTIDACDHAGSGVCLSSSPITIVDGALEGERCQVKLVKRTKRANFAKVVKLHTISTQRSEPFCEYYEKCGGCTLQHLNAANGLALKESALRTYISRQLQNIDGKELRWETSLKANIDYADSVEVHKADNINTSYRRRIRLALDARDSRNIKLGFRAKASKEVIDISTCAIALQSLNDCLRFVRERLNTLAQVNKLGHIVMTQGHESVELAFYMTQDINAKSYQWFSELAKAITGYSCQVLVSQKTQKLLSFNSMGASRTQKLILKDGHSVPIQIDSSQFIQVNQDVNRSMLNLAKSWLSPTQDDVLCDFFCGAGNFSIYLAHNVKTVFGYEGLDTLVQSANQNALALSTNNCVFAQLDLSEEKNLKELVLPKNALVILDPSREGAQALCEWLSKHQVAKILYVSCKATTFVRDAKALSKQYKIAKIKALDMFPFTQHLELMALFTPKRVVSRTKLIPKLTCS